MSGVICDLKGQRGGGGGAGGGRDAKVSSRGVTRMKKVRNEPIRAPAESEGLQVAEGDVQKRDSGQKRVNMESAGKR